MFVDEIGKTAGKVWTTLNTQGEMSIAALKKAVGSKDAAVDWALGWLAREDKLIFRKDKNVTRVELKK